MNKHILKIAFAITSMAAIIFFWSYFCDKLLTNTANEIDSNIASLEKIINTEDWNSANATLSQVHEKWDKTEYIWSMLIDHYEIDNISYSMARMSKFIETKSQNDAIAELGALRKYIKHIPEKNNLSIKNIL